MRKLLTLPIICIALSFTNPAQSQAVESVALAPFAGPARELYLALKNLVTEGRTNEAKSLYIEKLNAFHFRHEDFAKYGAQKEASGATLRDWSGIYQGSTENPSLAEIKELIQNLITDPKALAANAMRLRITVSQMSAATGYSVSTIEAYFAKHGIKTTNGVISNIWGLDTAANIELSGFVMMGDSWLSSDPSLVDQLKLKYSGKQVQNVAIGGSTSSDTLAQLMDFIGSGGRFAQDTIVILNLGLNDFLQGYEHDVTKKNLDKMAKIFAAMKVKIVLSGAPALTNATDLYYIREIRSPEAGSLAISPLYKELEDNNSNVSVVDLMAQILGDKSLLYVDGLHPSLEKGQPQFNTGLLAGVQTAMGK